LLILLAADPASGVALLQELFGRRPLLAESPVGKADLVNATAPRMISAKKRIMKIQPKPDIQAEPAIVLAIMVDSSACAYRFRKACTAGTRRTDRSP
jgi:hypothetical protein